MHFSQIRFSIKIAYAYHISSFLVNIPANLVLFNLITIFTFGEKYTLRKMGVISDIFSTSRYFRTLKPKCSAHNSVSCTKQSTASLCVNWISRNKILKKSGVSMEWIYTFSISQHGLYQPIITTTVFIFYGSRLGLLKLQANMTFIFRFHCIISKILCF